MAPTLFTLLALIACEPSEYPDPPAAGGSPTQPAPSGETAAETGDLADTADAPETTDTAGSTEITDTIGGTDASVTPAWFEPLDAPNVLFIVLDTQRADSIRRNLDWLPGWFLESGVTWSRLSTPSSHTPESAPWMLSGCDIRDGVSQTVNQNAPPEPSVPDGCVTMAERYNARGYTTLLSSGNYRMVSEQWYPAAVVEELTAGPLEWEDALVETIARADPGSPWSEVFWVAGARIPTMTPADYGIEDCDLNPHGVDLRTNEAIHDLQTDGLSEYTPEQLSEIAAAMACTYQVDTLQVLDGVSRLLERAMREGLLDNTVVVLTSDHGENLLDYWDYPQGYAPSEDWAGHGRKLYLHETDAFAHVWYSGATKDQTVERSSGIADLMQLVHHLSGVSAEGIRGALPWDRAEPIYQAKHDGEYYLGIAYDHPETGQAYRYLARADGGDERLFNQSEDFGEREDLILEGQRPPESIVEAMTLLRARL